MAKSGKYLYWNTGEGANATAEAVCVPAESFRGTDCGSGVVDLFFEPLSGTQANRMKVTLSVLGGKQIAVAKAIAEAIATMNAGILTIADDDNGVYLHSDITAIFDSSTTDAA